MKGLEWLRRISFLIIPILIGIFIFKGAVKGRKPPERKPEPEIQLRVETERVETLALPRELRGFGTVVADRKWSAVPQLSGKVTQIHPALKTGSSIGAGEVLFVVETVNQALEQESIRSDRRALESEIRQIDDRRAQLVKSLQAAQGTRASLVKEKNRYQKLYEAGASPASAVDARNREVLNQDRVIAEIQSNIDTLPAQKEAIRSRISGTEVRMQKQSVDISRSVVRAPFNGRLGEVYLEPGQVVNAGSPVFTMEGTDQVRIEARFPQSQLANFPLESASVTTPAGKSMRATVGSLGENVDPVSRSAAVQLSLPGDPNDILLPGALLRVTLRGEPHPELPVIPRSLVRNGQVFLIEDGRLTRRGVTVAFREGDYLAIELGLKGGETIVTSDPGLAPDGTQVQVANKEE